MEIVGIEHENSILELKEKVQKLKRKADAAEDALSDKNDECKNLAVRLAVSYLENLGYAGARTC